MQIIGFVKRRGTLSILLLGWLSVEVLSPLQSALKNKNTIFKTQFLFFYKSLNERYTFDPIFIVYCGIVDFHNCLIYRTFMFYQQQYFILIHYIFYLIQSLILKISVLRGNLAEILYQTHNLWFSSKSSKSNLGLKW